MIQNYRHKHMFRLVDLSSLQPHLHFDLMQKNGLNRESHRNGKQTGQLWERVAEQNPEAQQNQGDKHHRFDQEEGLRL